ncbi:MAG: hypothetical protein RLZZ182_1351 [Pseudomonadota bacterium]
MIDIHCHLLPGLDDGPRDLLTALALTRACAQDGVAHVVMTPHIYPGVFDNTLSEIRLASASFARQVHEEGLALQLSHAAEVRVGPEIMSLYEQGMLPLLSEREGFRHLLLEMPDGQIPLGMDKLCHWLLLRHITPVIAHPERNKAVMAQPHRMADFTAMGCKLQLTAGALLGDFGRQAQATAECLLDTVEVHAIASDAHGLQRRAPRMGAARDHLTRTRGVAIADRLTHTGPASMCGLQP